MYRYTLHVGALLPPRRAFFLLISYVPFPARFRPPECRLRKRRAPASHFVALSFARNLTMKTVCVFLCVVATLATPTLRLRSEDGKNCALSRTNGMLLSGCDITTAQSTMTFNKLVTAFGKLSAKIGGSLVLLQGRG